MKDPQIKKQLTQISQDMNAQKNIIVWKNRVFVPIQERQKNIVAMKIVNWISNILILAVVIYDYLFMFHDTWAKITFAAVVLGVFAFQTFAYYQWVFPRIMKKEYKLETHRLNLKKATWEVMDHRDRIIKKEKIQQNTVLPKLPLPTTETEHYRQLQENIQNQLTARLDVRFQAA
ncbi:hypothetical protein [Simonsiella muelleri]|uniref:hypothetical protein n=1 Tax=Simonsiella muelleri TaxID=72 RepID=UPI0023F38850|nr:hypothetical protein [Simonsiella muelleri]